MALRATSTTLLLVGTGCAESERAADSGPAHDPEPRDASMDARAPIDAYVAPDSDVPNDARADAPTDALVQDDGSIMLAAFPLDALVCTGPDHSADDDEDGGLGGYFGRCCAEAVCYTPELNASCDSAEVARQDRFYFGSGECNCGPIEGPFARPEDAGASPGECCYVAPLITCTGRPLSTDRGHLLAPVVTSLAWIA
jgi:hypothetical protein